MNTRPALYLSLFVLSAIRCIFSVEPMIMQEEMDSIRVMQRRSRPLTDVGTDISVWPETPGIEHSSSDLSPIPLPNWPC